MKLFYEYMVIFLNFSPTSNHLHPLQVENCDSKSRLFYDNATMFEATKNSIVDTTIIKVAQFKILYIFCSPRKEILHVVQ